MTTLAEPAGAVWDRVATYAVGTTDSPGALAERFEVDEDLVEHELGERSIQVCADCGWWFDEDADGASEGDFDPVCADCR